MGRVVWGEFELGGESPSARAHHRANPGPSVPARPTAGGLSGSPGAPRPAAPGGDTGGVGPPFAGERLHRVPWPRTLGPAAPQRHGTPANAIPLASSDG